MKYIKETPFTNFHFSKKLNCQTRKRALTLEEITILKRYYFSRYGYLGIENNDVYGEVKEKQHWVNQKFKSRGTTKLTPMNAEQFSLELFFCSYHLQGMALVDLANLKKKDLHLIEISDNFIEDSAAKGFEDALNESPKILCYEINITRQKTSHPTRIIAKVNLLTPFLYPFGSYIDESKAFSEEELEDYIFPIFDNDNNSEEIKFRRMTYMNYLVNVNLKRIAKRLKLADGITFYSARHSYASALYHANVPMGLIAQNMGRNPYEIETYLKEFDKENIYKANLKLLVSEQDEYKKALEERRNEARRNIKEEGKDKKLKWFEDIWRGYDKESIL